VKLERSEPDAQAIPMAEQLHKELHEELHEERHRKERQ
jgi:hypothetical protein